uniref:Predicted protein n=1 Tax=Physcomitrium patens TaxID=3218 RepID=A9U5H3_PHYPA
MDPSIASLFQAFSLSMQQQQSNDRKEALATKALQAVVNKIDQFDGRNISRYLRCYVREMELNRVSEKKMVALFGLATIPEIRDHITSITDRCGNSWEDFSHALKDKYFLEDADRVTKKLFLGWIERPNKNLQATELLREFEREDLLQTNFGKGGMRALVQDYLKEHETVVRESASYGARVDDEIGGSTETSEFSASIVSTMQEGKLPRKALLRTAATIRGRTGWKIPVESLSVHAYIAKIQHEALMEEKRRGNFDDTREGNSSKRQTRGDKAREAASQELPENLILLQHGWKQKYLTMVLFMQWLREKPLPKIVEGFKDFGELGTLQDDERILGVYEENGLEDSLESITSIGLGDNDKIVEIHSREVYIILEPFQAPEVTIKTRYKMADKKVKPVAGPLPKDSKEQMGEASKEASLRDPMSIRHQFIKETFEELKVGSDGSLL